MDYKKQQGKDKFKVCEMNDSSYSIRQAVGPKDNILLRPHMSETLRETNKNLKSKKTI